ncbi:ribose 5-phosphate isomerase B [Blastopirellula sp. JC732]|uniref:Ribose 5-phosphate isomerase B n=1 Tax=Blastopirellula sediminis TaxID=2894196 RepID=A0A9X1MPC4_9BACT|nr:ribose 5-phosphate isomerase B [Blastopirellula sediminis]MCC9606348.1 ribose 5-phosphate isomerase B [Blastopirellula sediminis]MCC9630354.1 ribose 5-phosphate isomerase B [Blastopirellula sediminis]
MKIVVASDHAGFQYKQAILEHLQKLGHETADYGTFSPESCDYPDFIIPAAKAVADGEFDRGIVLGGSGNGEAIAANRVQGVRCAYCWNIETAKLGRKHNKANVIAIGERLIELPLALEIVEAWLAEEFEGGRHERRIAKLDEPIN